MHLLNDTQSILLKKKSEKKNNSIINVKRLKYLFNSSFIK